MRGVHQVFFERMNLRICELKYDMVSENLLKQRATSSLVLPPPKRAAEYMYEGGQQ